MTVSRVVLLLAALVASVVAAVVTLVVVVGVFPAVRPVPSWASSSGKVVPGDFLVVCYPASEAGAGGGGVQLYDKADGAPVSGATLQRALANTMDEMKGSWVTVNAGGGQMLWVRTADLRYEPPVNATIEYDAALAAQRMKAGFFSVKVERVRGADGVVTSRLKWMPDDDHVEEYVSTVANNTVTPVEMYRYFGPGEALKNIPQFMGAVLAAGVAGLVTLAVGVLLALRLTRRPAAVAVTIS